MAEAVADNVPAKAAPIDGKPPLFGLSFLENLSQMTMLRQVGLLVGLAASVAIGFAWCCGPSNPITGRCTAAWRVWTPSRSWIPWPLRHSLHRRAQFRRLAGQGR